MPQDPGDPLEALDYGTKVHYRVVFKEVADTIESLTSVKMMFRHLLQAALCMLNMSLPLVRSF